MTCRWGHQDRAGPALPFARLPPATPLMAQDGAQKRGQGREQVQIEHGSRCKEAHSYIKRGQAGSRRLTLHWLQAKEQLGSTISFSWIVPPSILLSFPYTLPQLGVRLDGCWKLAGPGIAIMQSSHMPYATMHALVCTPDVLLGGVPAGCLPCLCLLGSGLRLHDKQMG